MNELKCVTCNQVIADGQTFVRLREDAEKREMTLAHSGCTSDPGKIRTMNKRYRDQIADYLKNDKKKEQPDA